MAGEFGGAGEDDDDEDEGESCFGGSGSGLPIICPIKPGLLCVFCEEVSGSEAGSGSFFSGAGTAAGGGVEGEGIVGGLVGGAASGAGAGAGAGAAAGSDTGAGSPSVEPMGRSSFKRARLSTAGTSGATTPDLLPLPLSLSRCDKDLAWTTGVSERTERRNRVLSVE